jgi:hypothetical protein
LFVQKNRVTEPAYSVVSRKTGASHAFLEPIVLSVRTGCQGAGWALPERVLGLATVNAAPNAAPASPKRVRKDRRATACREWVSLITFLECLASLTVLRAFGLPLHYREGWSLVHELSLDRLAGHGGAGHPGVRLFEGRATRQRLAVSAERSADSCTADDGHRVKKKKKSIDHPSLDDSRLSKDIKWGYQIFTSTPEKPAIRARTLLV